MTPIKIIARLDEMKTIRQNWEPLLEDVANLALPRKNDIQRTATKGDDRTVKLYDSTAIHENELLASHLHSMLTNPMAMWFELTTGDAKLDQSKAVSVWLQETARKLHTILNNSNFQTEIHEIYLDLGVLGTSALMMLEDDELIARFHARPIGELYIAENNKGFIDTVYRVFKWSLKQIVNEWGEKALTSKMADQYRDHPLDEIEIVHAVYPRADEYRNKKKGKKGKDFADVYITIEEEHPLEEGGFDEFPYAIARWQKLSGETYGRSPAMKCLPDIKMINSMKKTIIRGAQKIVDPPLQAPDDGIQLPIRTNSNALNYYRKGIKDRIEPIATGGRPDIGIDVLEHIKTAIKEAFFTDRLKLVENDRMTATEVNQRTEENLRVLGPLLGRLHKELLAPIISRVLNIALRKQELEELPQAISDKGLQIKYSSMIAKAQRTSEAQNLGRALQDLAPVLELVPSLLNNIDVNEATRITLRIHGVSEQMIKSKEDVEQMEKMQQEQAQQAQKQQQEGMDAENMSKISNLAKVSQGAENVQ